MGKVIVETGMRTGPLQTGLARSRAMVDGWAGDIGKTIAGAFAFGAVTTGIRDMLDKAETVADLSDRFEVPAEMLQRLGNVASVNGGSIQSVARAINRLAFNTQNAIDGQKIYIRAFERLGVTLEDLRRQSLEEIFDKMSDSSRITTNRAESLAAAIQIMGRAGSEVFVTMQMGSEEIRKQGDRMGVWEEKTTRSLARINTDFRTLRNQLTVLFGPVIVFVGNLITAFIEVGSLGAFMLMKVLVVLNDIRKEFKDTVLEMLSILSGVSAVIQKLFDRDFKGAASSAEELGEKIKNSFNDGIKGMTDGVKSHFKDFMDVAGDTSDKLDRMFNFSGNHDGRKKKTSLFIPKDDESIKLEKEKLLKRIADERDQVVLKQMSREERINELMERRRALLKAANLTSVEGLNSRIEAYRISKLITSELQAHGREEEANRKKAKLEAQARLKNSVSVSADFLARVGGGGNVSRASDSTRTLVDEARKTNRILERIERKSVKQKRDSSDFSML